MVSKMDNSIVIDTWVNEDCTLGRLTYGDFQCFTLELPWHNNEKGISCIIDGTFKAKKYKSPTKGWVILLQYVPNRTYVEIHSGNFTYQIEGCVLVGDGIKYLDNDSVPDVTNSAKTLDKLMELLPNSFIVTINRKY